MRKFWKQNKFLREVRNLVFGLIRPDQADVFLFGSWARGSVRKHSDIDLGILPKTQLPADLLSKLREALEESHVPYRVEIMDLSRTDVRFRKLVIKHGILWNF